MRHGKVVAIFLLMLSTLSPLASYGADGFLKGTVEFMRVHDAASHPGWVPPRFWFTLNGVTSAGGCPAAWNGRVLFVAESKEAYLTILSASLTGKEVAIYYMDTQQTNGLCRALYITVGNPPPLF